MQGRTQYLAGNRWYVWWFPVFCYLIFKYLIAFSKSSGVSIPME